MGILDDFKAFEAEQQQSPPKPKKPTMGITEHRQQAAENALQQKADREALEATKAEERARIAKVKKSEEAYASEPIGKNGNPIPIASLSSPPRPEELAPIWEELVRQYPSIRDLGVIEQQQLKASFVAEPEKFWGLFDKDSPDRPSFGWAKRRTHGAKLFPFRAKTEPGPAGTYDLLESKVQPAWESNSKRRY